MRYINLHFTYLFTSGHMLISVLATDCSLHHYHHHHVRYGVQNFSAVSCSPSLKSSMPRIFSGILKNNIDLVYFFAFKVLQNKSVCIQSNVFCFTFPCVLFDVLLCFFISRCVILHGMLRNKKRLQLVTWVFFTSKH